VKKLSLLLFACAIFLVPSKAHAQSTLERCQAGQCVGFGPPVGPAMNGYIYQDLSQTPIAFSCGKGGVWASCGGGSSSASACPLKNATNICITEAPYNAVGNGVTDNTAAFLAAITALTAVGGGTIWLPDGIYIVNGPLLDTGGANAILPMPKIANYGANMALIGIRGYTIPVPTTPMIGAVIQTALNSGNLFAGFDSAAGGGKPPFTNVWLDLEDLTIWDTTVNPGAAMVDATNLQNLTAKNLLIGAAGNLLPTNAAGWAIKYPGSANNVRINVDNIAVGGFYNGFKLGEHSHTGSIYAGNTTNCFVFDPGTNAGDGSIYNNNSISVDYMWGLGCTNFISSGSQMATVNVQVADSESSVTDFNDASNLLHGIVNYAIPLGANHCAPIINGAINLQINSLQCSVAAANPFLENWKSQDGSGTTLVNTGSDSTNTATATNVTWSTTATGFAGVPVAVYNGTTSVSVAASATQTAFNGATPFSACAWFNMSTLTYAGVSSAYLFSNLSAATGNPGWRVGVFGTGATPVGALDIYLINNVTTGNFINVHTAPGGTLVTAGTLTLACMTYDGSKTAAGVAAYINGAPVTLLTVTNGLTGSIASTAPLYIGGEFDGNGGFPGALGRVRVYSRKLSSSEISAMYTTGPNAI
jgi:hypothetical protein